MRNFIIPVTIALAALSIAGVRAQGTLPGLPTAAPQTPPAVPPTVPPAAPPAVPTPQAAPPASPVPLPAAPAALSVNWGVRPQWPTNPQILKRTPPMDGTIVDSAWTPFYTVATGAITGTVYCDWDDNYLYLAARTNQPAQLVIDLDAGDDGWLRGSDNLELNVNAVLPGEKPMVSGRILNASDGKTAPVWTTDSLSLASVLTAGRQVNGGQEEEIAIPKDMASLMLRAGTLVGLRVEFLPAAGTYVPSAPYEPHLLLDANLTDAQAQAVQGVNPHLLLSDYKCVAGEKLFATLTVLNQTDQAIPLKYVAWEGDEASKNAVDTYRLVAPAPLLSRATSRFGYKTVLPGDLPNGTYTLKVRAGLADGREIEASAAFTVVDAIHAQMSGHPDPLLVVGTTRLDLQVDIASAVPDHFRGLFELIKYPPAWQLEGKPVRSVVVYGEDKSSISHIYFTLPANTQQGDYPIEARILWYNRTWDLHTVVHVTGNEAAAAPAAK